MRIIAAAIAFFLSALAAAAQPSTTFNTYISGLPTATAPGATDQFYIRQGGASKQIPYSTLTAPTTLGPLLSPAFDSAFGSTRGSVLERGAAGWNIVVPGATAGLPLLSRGTGADPSYGPVADPSTVVGSGAAKWNPLFFGNPGTAIVHRFNRVFVGEATLGSSDFGPVTTKDWLETLVPNTLAGSMFISVDTEGNLAVTGASRCSDFRTIFGSSSGGCQGGTFYGYNDDTVGGAISCGVCGTAIRKSGAPGISVNQFDAVNGGSVVDVTPFGGIPGGAVIAGLFTAGAVTPTGFTNANVSAAWVASAGISTRHRKGGVCQDGALDVSLGAGTDGVCIEMARNQSMRWLNSGLTTDAEVWANATGFHISPALPVASGGTGDTGTAWTAFTASVTCTSGTWTTASSRSKTIGKTTFIEIDTTLGAAACTGTTTFTLPNTGNSTGVITGRDNNTAAIVSCQVSSASATAVCATSAGGNFAANAHVVASGVYENQ